MLTETKFPTIASQVEAGSAGARPAIEVSIVVPVFNECESLPILHGRLTAVLHELQVTYEMIFVDDGSTDGSVEVLAALVSQDPHVVAIEFRRNMGKSAALSSGFRQARGRVIITIDADLQDEPEEIPRFLQRLEEGYDLVSGWKFPRRDPWRKTIPSRILNALIRRMAGIPLHDINCGFKAYRRQVIEAISLYGELHRYIPFLAHQYGFRMTEITVTHRARPYGRSKYTLAKQLVGCLDLATVLFLTRFSRKPLHFLGGTGAVCFGTGGLLATYLSWVRMVQGLRIGQRPLLLLSVFLMLLGVQFVFFGLLAEMITYFQHRDYQQHIRQVTQRLESSKGRGQ